ncbi:manganese peroxidase 1 [Mycena epipterygia]|nr:manganese peroxidase 1 [Mycena epipterygia]
MKFSTLSTLSVVYVATVGATPTSRATCSKGRTAAGKGCCVWYDVLDDIQANIFEGGKCGDDAHDALRLSFHDAIGYSPLLTKQGSFGGGGADGSLIAFAATELTYAANDGLDEIVAAEKQVADHYNVSYGDMIQFAAAVSVRNCAGGPRIAFLTGRLPPVAPAPDGLVPDAGDSVTTMLARVGDAGLSPEELVDLLASHSVGVQEDVDVTIVNTPFDTTPTVLDTNFYLETLLRGTTWPGTPNNPGEVMSPIQGEFRLQSDAAIARDPRTACHWQAFVNDQNLLNFRFGAAMAKMALLGQNQRTLQDCSVVIPVPTLPKPGNAKLPAGKTALDLELSAVRSSIVRCNCYHTLTHL